MLIVGVNEVGLVVRGRHLQNCSQSAVSLKQDGSRSILFTRRHVSTRSVPGVFTATEALQATHLGATHLKLFPAGCVPSHYITALRAVLPKRTKIFAVGGIGDDGYQEWLDAGASGFGIGSRLYTPGASADAVYKTACRIVKVINDCL